MTKNKEHADVLRNYLTPGSNDMLYGSDDFEAAIVAAVEMFDPDPRITDDQPWINAGCPKVWDEKERQHCAKIAFSGKRWTPSLVQDLLLRERAALRVEMAGELLYVEEREQLRAKALIARTETAKSDALHHKQLRDEIQAENKLLRTAVVDTRREVDDVKDALIKLQTKHEALVKAARAIALNELGSGTANRLADALQGEP